MTVHNNYADILMNHAILRHMSPPIAASPHARVALCQMSLFDAQNADSRMGTVLQHAHDAMMKQLLRK